MPTGWELPTPTLPNEGYPLPSHLHLRLTKSPKLTMDRFPHHDVLKEHTLYFYISLQASLSESPYKTLVVGITTVRSRSNLRARLSLLDDVADSRRQPKMRSTSLPARAQGNNDTAYCVFINHKKKRKKKPTNMYCHQPQASKAASRHPHHARSTKLNMRPTTPA